MTNSNLRTPRLLQFYHLFLSDEDTVGWIRRVASHYSIDSLVRLLGSQEASVRQASIFAIGMLGAQGQIAELGPMLSDRDRRVRVLADDAIKAIEHRLLPLNGRAMLERTLVLIEQDRMSAAITTANRLLIAYPSCSEAYCRRALALFNIGEVTSAKRDCEMSIKLNSYSYMSYVGLGQCHLEMDEPRESLEVFRQAIAIYPDLDAVRVQIKRLERMLRETT